ncbi:MAG: aminotransferase class V-fold PLP-dependent enzyme [Gemmataceae bacterium]|nr:aminotransferase class V-fold PLP-dependent enzyme [Gemmataceae bacterium]
MDWTALRAELPVTERWAYLDHAAVAPLTRRALEAMREWADDLTANGLVNERRWLTRIDEVRSLAARLIGADPLDVAFVKNTSEGIGIVAEGFPWQSGDNVVIAEEEYPANQYPWLNLGGRGVEVRRIASRPDGRLWIDDIVAAFDARTRLLSLSWVEFASGFRNDLDALGALCRARGIAFFVDAIQGLGVFPLDVGKTPIDFLAADGHKWLLGPEGAGLLWVRREWIERLRPIDIGWNSVVGARDFTKIDLQLKPHAGRYESGSLNVAGITALGGSLEWLLEIGIDKVAGRVLELTDHLCRRVAERQADLTVFSSRRPGAASGIVSLAYADPARVGAVVRDCRANGIIINKRAGRVRVSPHCYNSVEEIDRLFGYL